MACLLVVRHARSTWNDAGRWQGQADPPLSGPGFVQAALGAERLAEQGRTFDLVVSSDLSRASRTAELIARRLGLDVPHLVDAGLREHDVGRWSGLTRAEIDRAWPGRLARFDAGTLPGPPGGERRDAFDRRITASARRLAGVIRDRRSSQVLVVTHGGVIRALQRVAGRAEGPVPHLGGHLAQTDGESVLLLEPVSLLDSCGLDGGRGEPGGQTL